MSNRRGAGRIVPAATFRRLYQARALIESRYTEPLPLDALARAVGLSKFHLVRTFERVYGRTPHRYLTECRLRQAKRLLRSSRLSVTEVCMEVGFSSLGSFSSLFAREVGRPPQAFQRHVRRLFPVPASYRRPFVPLCFAQNFGAIFEKHAPPAG